MNMHELLKTNSKITLSVTGEDLENFAEHVINRALQQHKPNNPQPKQEIFLTGKEVDAKLKISRVTRHQWERKGILKFIRMGNSKRYKLSDIENIGK